MISSAGDAIRSYDSQNSVNVGDLNSCASIAELGADILLDEYVVNINKCDSLKSHLSHEYENDRMFRLMLQLGNNMLLIHI